MTRATGAASDHVADVPFSLLTTGRVLGRVGARFGIAPRLRPVRHQGLRIALSLAVTWIAPMVLASVQPERPSALSFTADFEPHVRALVAIPLLLFADVQIDPTVRRIVRSLASRRRCRAPDELRARARSLQHLVRHPISELVIVALAFLFVPAWIRNHTSGRETWIFRTGSGGPELTAAGTWTAWVIAPLYMFLLLRWLWRWIVLALVFATSAPLLRPVVSHGDRCGGFSFVSRAPARFAWVIAGASTLVSARMLFAIVHDRIPARGVEHQALAIVGLALVLAFFPLFAFAPNFAHAKRLGLRRHRTVLEGHARNIERKWFGRAYPADVSSEESSSLADASSVYDRVSSMRIIPYLPGHLLAVSMAALLPMLPLLSKVASIDAIVRRVFAALL